MTNQNLTDDVVKELDLQFCRGDIC